MANKYVGEIYVNKMTLSGSNARRFENGSIGLHDAVIIVKTNAVYAGRQGAQTYPMGTDESLGLMWVDLADLWFKNQSASNAGVVHIIGTTCK